MKKFNDFKLTLPGTLSYRVLVCCFMNDYLYVRTPNGRPHIDAEETHGNSPAQAERYREAARRDAFRRRQSLSSNSRPIAVLAIPDQDQLEGVRPAPYNQSRRGP